MKYILGSVVMIVMMLTGIKPENTWQKSFNRVEVQTLFMDSTMSIRALELYGNNNFTFATSNGWVGGSSINEIEEHVDSTIKLEYDSIVPNFRSLANVKETTFALSIASPALLYKIDVKGNHLVYQEDGEGVFYDSMEFWNDQEGIAIGDSIDGCLSVIITRDGGNTWSKLSCEQLPKGIDGEGAFAASDTNIAIYGDQAWVATASGRVLFSSDKGMTWAVRDTPIIKDKETEGIYSIAFYDAMNGFAIGGDYTKPDDNSKNKIRTSDGGQSWQLVSENQGPGYRSCVQYIPNSQGHGLVAVGYRGIDVSSDSGDTWKHLSDEGFYTLRFSNDSIAYAAGQGRISKLVFK